MRRTFSTASPLRQSDNSNRENERDISNKNDSEEEEGAFTRRLAEMTEQALLEGGRSARKNLQEAGFSEELKRKLEERLKDSAFKSEHAGAISLANLPVCNYRIKEIKRPGVENY